jgi:hypothetical protein
MILKGVKHTILGLALVAGTSLAMGHASVTHASSHGLINATWSAGTLSVNGSFFTVGAAIDVVVFYGSGAVATTTTVATNGNIHRSFSTLTLDGCPTPGNLGLGYTPFAVVAVDRATERFSDIACVAAPCTNNAQPGRHFLPSPLLGGKNNFKGVVSAWGSAFTPSGGVDVTTFQPSPSGLFGLPIATSHTTATTSICAGILCTLAGLVSTSFSVPATWCDSTEYSLLAVDDLSHQVSTMAVTPPCQQPH